MNKNCGRPRLPGIALLLVVACVAGAIAPGTASAGLTGEQQQALKSAENALASAEADVKAAAGSAGTAARPATGSRLKLTRMRLSSAAERLIQVAGVLKGLPGGDDAVKAVLDRHGAAVTEIRRIEAVLAGGASPGAGGGDTAAPGGTEASDAAPAAPAAPKLDYRQEKYLKDARYYVNELEQCCAAASDMVKRLDGEGEPAVHRDVEAALGTVAKGWQRHGYIAENLGKLPQDHPRVKPLVEQVAGLKGTLGAVDSRLKAADAELGKLTDMANYPAFQQDFQRFQALIRRYRDFGSLTRNPEQLAKVVREGGDVQKELQRIVTTYRPLIEQKTDAGAKLEGLMSAYKTNVRDFATKLWRHAELLPKKIDGHLTEVRSIADEAVAGGHPHWFGEGSGIEQQLGYAELDVAVLEIVNKEKGGEYREKIEKVRAEVAKLADSLREQIIENNPLPPDRYAGGDRKDLVALATSAWREIEKDAKVLGARFPSEKWKRTTEWRLQNRTFYKVDSSRLQVQLLVDAGDGLAVIRPVNIYKNHLEGDVVTASPMDTTAEKPRPQRILLADKIK